MTPELEQLFLLAREATSRRAFTEFKKKTGGDIAAFRQLRPLDDERLRTFSRSALADARGNWLSGAEPFPSVLWMCGATATHGGRAFKGTLRQFAELLLPERARAIAPKREGWVIEPVTNPEGRRTNEKTLAVHALFLDCDGTGEWEWLLYELAGLNLAHIAYQSGGWTPETPKWRAVLPLARAFDTSSPDKQVAWKGIYNHVRVVVGSLSRLVNVGFDPATETPCCPWFLTEKRSATDPERRITWRPGHALDLDALAGALPPVPVDAGEVGEYATAAPLSIDEEKFEQIVDALSAATVHVPSGRRDIYLAMPAVMLNRGVQPDDVRRIVEEVSSRYPRVHADKHADNLHNAETTIARWEAEGPSARITQIGTLQALAPEVAAALDEVLPDLHNKAMEEAVLASLGDEVTPAPLPAPTASAPSLAIYLPPDPPAPSSPPKKARMKLSPLGKKLSPVAKRLTKHKLAERRIEGGLMLLVLRGQPLPSAPSVEGVDAIVCKLSRALGYNLKDATWLQALELMSPTLLSMDFTQSKERVLAAETAFWEGRRGRNKVTAKKEKRKAEDKERRAARARKCR